MRPVATRTAVNTDEKMFRGWMRCGRLLDLLKNNFELPTFWPQQPDPSVCQDAGHRRTGYPLLISCFRSGWEHEDAYSEESVLLSWIETWYFLSWKNKSISWTETDPVWPGKRYKIRTVDSVARFVYSHYFGNT